MAKKKGTEVEESVVNHLEDPVFTSIIRAAAIHAATEKGVTTQRIDLAIDSMSDRLIGVIAAKEIEKDMPAPKTYDGPTPTEDAGLVGAAPPVGGIIQNVEHLIVNMDPAVRQRIVNAILSLFGI